MHKLALKDIFQMLIIKVNIYIQTRMWTKWTYFGNLQKFIALYLQPDAWKISKYKGLIHLINIFKH